MQIRNRTWNTIPIMVLLAALAVWSCSSGDDDDNNDSGTTGEGGFMLTLLDAPVDEADAVYITIEAVEVHYLGDDDSDEDSDDEYGDDSDDEYGDDSDDEYGDDSGDDSADDSGDDSDDDSDDDTSDDTSDDDDAQKDQPEDDDEYDDEYGDDEYGDDEYDDDDEDDDNTGAGWITLNVEKKRYNLLDLAHDAGAVLTDQALPSGDYNQMRLKLACDGADAPSIVIDGTENPLKIPSGCQSGIKMPHHWTITDADDVWLMMDFDVRKSIHETGNGKYIMKPVIHLIDGSDAGRIKGTVIPTDAGATVYVFEAGDDMSNPDEDSVSSSIPRDDGSFIIPALIAGTYDVLITSDEYDDWTVDDVTVDAETTTDLGTIDLEATDE